MARLTIDADAELCYSLFANFIEKEDEYLTHNSPNFHLKQGYTEAAHMKGIGKKFDRWYDLKWFQKKI